MGFWIYRSLGGRKTISTCVAWWQLTGTMSTSPCTAFISTTVQEFQLAHWKKHTHLHSLTLNSLKTFTINQSMGSIMNTKWRESVMQMKAISDTDHCQLGRQFQLKWGVFQECFLRGGDERSAPTSHGADPPTTEPPM